MVGGQSEGVPQERIHIPNLSNSVVNTFDNRKTNHADGSGRNPETGSIEVASYQIKSHSRHMAFITRFPSMPGDFTRHFYEPFIILMTFPSVLYAAYTYGALLSWYSVLSTVESEWFFDPPYNWDSAQIGLFNLAPYIGQMIGSVIGGPMNDWAIMWLAKRNDGVYEPEMRLWISIPSVILCTLGILMLEIGLAHLRHTKPAFALNSIHCTDFMKGMSWVLIAFGWAINSVATAMAMDVALTYVTELLSRLCFLQIRRDHECCMD